MNVATARSPRVSKRLSTSDPALADPALAVLQPDVKLQSIHIDDLRRHWAQIVAGAWA